MPLEKSRSPAAFKRNVKTLMGEVGKSKHVGSRSQALAIAYSIKQRGKADGGAVEDPWAQGVRAAEAGTVTPSPYRNQSGDALLAMGRAGDTLRKNAPLLAETAPGRIVQSLGRAFSGQTPYAGPGLRREDYTDDPTAPQPIEPMINDAMNVADLMSLGSMPIVARNLTRRYADGGDVSDDPFERAAYRVRQGARPEGGRQEGAMSAALSDPSFLFNASPFGLTREALQAINQGEYGRAAATAAPLAVPLAGPALRGIGAIMRAAPKTAATAAGALGVGLPSSTETGYTAEPSSSDWWRTPRESFQHPEFTPPTLTAEEREPFTQPAFAAPEPPSRPSLEGLGPMARKETQARYDARLAQAAAAAEEARKAHAARQEKLDVAARNFLDQKTAKAREDWERARDLAHTAYLEEQSRLDQRDLAYKHANQSFREAHPNATLALPAAGAAIAGLLPYGGRMLARGVNNEIAGQLGSAVTRARSALAADAATRAAARGEMKAGLGPGGVGRMKDESLTTGGTLGSLGVGALGSGEASLIPYEIDMATLPEGSHGRQEAENPMNWAQRGGFGSLGGILGSSYGLKAPLLRSKAVPPVSEMEGLLAGLKTAPRTAKAAPAPRKRTRKIESDTENVIPLRESGMAAGGSVPWYTRGAASSFAHAGLIHSPVAGRTDKIGAKVRGDSFVFPADTVSSLGQGNTLSGANALAKMFKMGPYGTSMPAVSKAARPIRQKFADGGATPDKPVDIVAAGGEVIVPPQNIAAVMGDDMDHNHNILNKMVVHIRKKTIKQLRSLKPPKAS